MPFVSSQIRSFASPILLPRKGIFVFRPADNPKIIGGSGVRDCLRHVRKSAWDLLLVAWRSTGTVRAIGAGWRC